MSFAPFVSLAVIIGAAVVVLTAVVGYGYYCFVREFFDKPDAYEP
jgi:nitroreductase